MPAMNIMQSRAALSWLVLLTAIWFPVIYLLGAQWSLFAQYQYGWAVPFLCLFLAGQNLPLLPQKVTPRWKKSAAILLMSAGMVYWAMRILQEANPLWRLASYGLAFAAVAMTLLVIYLSQGPKRAAHFIFPVAFFLVAVPWPSPIEQAIIQSFTRCNASLVVAAMGLAGVPALLHGNVIEVSTGLVGIDEACSGIRSFQATLMIALFFGEFYKLPGGPRWGLLAAGPALALAFNLVRTMVLVFVAARAGLPMMARWHDPTGVILLVGCFLCLWAVAMGLARLTKREALSGPATGQMLDLEFSGFQNWSISTLTIWLIVWAAAVEISTEGWFRSHEVHGRAEHVWTAQWPSGNATLYTNIIPQNSLRILQCDENTSARWIGKDNIFWQAFFLRWLPANTFYGRAKEALSKFHNPADCLSAGGMELRTQLAPVPILVRPGLSLTFDRYVFTAGGNDLYVFFAQTEDMTGSVQASTRMTHLARWRAALAGSRNYGQNNFEVALTGPETSAAALSIFSEHLPELIKCTSALP